MSGGAFPVTPWTLVREAARQDTGVLLAEAPAAEARPSEARPAGDGRRCRRRSLGELVELYRGPLRVYLRARHRLPDADADDVLGSFVADKVVAGRLLGSADAGRGRFRTLLLVSLDRHVIDHHRAAGRRARLVEAGRDAARQAASSRRAEEAHARAARAWAKQVLAGVIAEVSRRCHEAGRPDVWLVLEQRVILPALDGLPPAPPAELARRLRLEKEQQVSNLLVTGKRLFARTLREAVATYAGDDEVDDEVRDLWNAFAGR